MSQIISASQGGASSAANAASAIEKKTRSAAMAMLDLSEKEYNLKIPSLQNKQQQDFKAAMTQDLSWADSFITSITKVLSLSGAGEEKK